VTIPALSLPEASLADVTSQGLDVSATTDRLALVADAGVLKVTLSVTPTAGVHTDELRLSGVRSSASIGEVRRIRPGAGHLTAAR
jgi:hypothetical protein